MIISNSHRFIFAKTRKVAGSSIELKLSQYLGANDMMTDLQERDGGSDLSRSIRKLRHLRMPARGIVPVRLSQHSPLTRAYRAFGRALEDHLVVTVERNPWDRAVSAFFWARRREDFKARPFDEQRAAFKAHIFKYGADSYKARLAGHWKHRVLSHKFIYMIDGVSMADVLIRYECLAEDLAAFGERVGLPEPLSLDGVSAKAALRPKKARAYQDMYDDETRAFVAELSRWEIDAYGYDFEGTAKPHFTPDPRRHEAKDAYLRRHGG